jgi:glycosyltransferase domain-containing protein
MLEKLTLYIPTINRPQFLNRSLKYYNSMEFDGSILIGDSSNSDKKSENLQAISKYPNLQIDYHHFKLGDEYHHHDAVKTYLLLGQIKTPYTTFAGDDDFQIPDGLKLCVEFLENNPDYVAAHGERLNFTLDDEMYGNIIGLDIHGGYNWETDNAVNRWQDYMRKGVATTYYIHRTSAWKKYYQFSKDAKSNYLGNELIPCSLCALLGKVKKLDCLTTAFQRDNPIRKFSFAKTTLWDLINGKNWSDSATIFRKAVIEQIMETTTEEKASDIFYQEFWYHCLNIMHYQFNTKYSTPQEKQYQQLDMTKLPVDDPFFPVYKVLLGESGEILNGYLEKIHGLDIREGSTNEDYKKLIELVLSIAKSGMKVVEVGSWKGGTTGVLGEVIKEQGGELTVIDPWENETVPINHDDIYEIFKNNMKTLGLEETIRIIKKSSREGHKEIENESMDLVFLDGLHMYGYISHDIKDYYPKLRKGGILCGHDCNLRFEGQPPEVQKEVEENIHTNCVSIKSLNGKKVHCGVTKAIFDYFGNKYQTSSNPMCSVWWVIKE